MEKAKLKDLGMTERTEVLRFLKKLWNGEGADCPVCGERLTILHRKAKKSDCDWKCTSCDLVFRTIGLLDELNEKIPQ